MANVEHKTSSFNEIIRVRESMKGYGVVASRELNDSLVRIGLPQQFAGHLLGDGDDWAFIIKLHALIEAGLAQAFAVRSKPKPTKKQIEAFRKLRFQGKTGQLAKARAAKWIDRNDQRFLEKLAAYRRLMVHRIEHVSFNLKAEVHSLDERKRTSLARALALHIEETGAMTNLMDYPRFAFIGAALHVLEKLVR